MHNLDDYYVIMHLKTTQTFNAGFKKKRIL